MAQHPSLRSSAKSKQHRSVLKRFEKIEKLKKEERWKEGEDSAFGLPKVKILRFKVKKEKAQEAAAEVTGAQAEGASGTEGKEQAQGQGEKKETPENKKETKKK